MPKERRANSSSSNRVVSPYTRSLKTLDRNNSPFANEKEWEEVRCPICMEHPHNAVLLLCSSRGKGCRPFICDTSHRHSNCLDQFCKSSKAKDQQAPLACPLCRGLVTGWQAIQRPRIFMNSKSRSCSLETCGFSGNYDELRKHARLEHPSERPSEPSPTRQSNWRRMEQARDIEDAFAHQSDMEFDDEVGINWGSWAEDDWAGWSPDALIEDYMWNNDASVFPSEDIPIDVLLDDFIDTFGNLPSSPEQELIDPMDDSGVRSSRPRSSYYGEDAIIISTSGSNHHMRSGMPILRSSYRMENSSILSDARSNDQGRGDALSSSRSRSSYHGENDGIISTSGSGNRRQRRNNATNSMSRSTYHS